MTARQQPGFDPDQLAAGDNCTVRFGSGRPTRAELVRRTRNPDWFIVRRWNPYERRWATKLIRLHRSAFVSRPKADHTGR